jgi:hypothetical protein
VSRATNVGFIVRLLQDGHVYETFEVFEVRSEVEYLRHDLQFAARRSGMLEDRGYRRVVTSKPMVAPKYDQVGFEPHHDGRGLELQP